MFFLIVSQLSDKLPDDENTSDQWQWIDHIYI